MSYRNPKQFIDTQSGQHYRNLINSVVKTGDDLAKDIIRQNAEVAKRNNDIITNAEKREQQILGRLGNVTAGNPAFNFGEGFEYYINQYSDLNIAVDTGTSQDPVAARRRMAEIEQLPIMAKDGLAGLIEMTEDLIEKANKRGQMGGLDLASMQPLDENGNPRPRKVPNLLTGELEDGTSDLEALLIMADQLKGARSFNVVEENGKLVPAYTLGNRQYTYTQIQNYLAGPESGGLFNSIPDETKSYTEAAKLALVPDPNDPQKQVLNPKYYENQEPETRLDDKGNTIVFKRVNTKLLKDPTEPIYQTLKADAASLSNADKISFYNNILVNEENPNQFQYGKLLNKEEEEKFIEAYIDYGLNNYVQQQHQVDFIKAVEPEKQEEPKSSDLQLEAFEEIIDKKGGKEKIYSAFTSGPASKVADELGSILDNLAIPHELLQVQDDDGNVDQDLIEIKVNKGPKIKIDVSKPQMALEMLKYAISGDYGPVRELLKQN